jgi:hypothetical protein
LLTNPIRTLGLLAALGSVSCGGNQATTGADPYLGFVDSTGFDSKFVPGSSGYAPLVVSAAGQRVPVYPLGSVPAASFKTKVADLAPNLATVYELPADCEPGRVAPPAPGVFADDRQYPVYDRLPLSTTSTTNPTLPLVKVVKWNGASSAGCNAIKSHESLQAGAFSGEAEALAEGALPTLAFRPVIDTTANTVSNLTVTLGTTRLEWSATSPLGTIKPFPRGEGWFRGLQLAHVAGGELPVDAQGNVRVMDAVLVHPAWRDASRPATTSSMTSHGVLVLAAAPGTPGFSPIVAVREWFIPTTMATAVTPASFTSLCFDGCNPASTTAVDFSPTGAVRRQNNRETTPSTYLFIAENP